MYSNPSSLMQCKLWLPVSELGSSKQFPRLYYDNSFMHTFGCTQLLVPMYIRYCLSKWTFNWTTIQDPLSRELDELDEESTLQLSRGHQITGSKPELHLAARREDLQTVRLLVDDQHQNPLQKDKYGDTALHTAAQGGSLTYSSISLRRKTATLHV